MNAIISGKQVSSVGVMSWEKVYSLPLSDTYSDKAITEEEYNDCYIRIEDLYGYINFLRLYCLGSISKLGANLYLYKSQNSSNPYVVTCYNRVVTVNYVSIGSRLYEYCKSIEIGYLKIS